MLGGWGRTDAAGGPPRITWLKTGLLVPSTGNDLREKWRCVLCGELSAPLAVKSATTPSAMESSTPAGESESSATAAAAARAHETTTTATATAQAGARRHDGRGETARDRCARRHRKTIQKYTHTHTHSFHNEIIAVFVCVVLSGAISQFCARESFPFICFVLSAVCESCFWKCMRLQCRPTRVAAATAATAARRRWAGTQRRRSRRPI